MGAAVFILKGLGYRILKTARRVVKVKGEGVPTDELVIFSEGKKYWPTFKPIVEALLARGQAFRYVTLDIEDPALTIEHSALNSRHLADGPAASAQLAKIKARVMLAATPGLGRPGSSWPRPAGVDCLVHVWPAFGGVEAYPEPALDYYDVLVLAADCFEAPLRALEARRNLNPKECVTLGLPSWDELKKKSSDISLSGPDSEAVKLNDVLPLAEKNLALDGADLAALRDSRLTNFGCAGPAIAAWLVEKCGRLSGRTNNPAPVWPDAATGGTPAV
jgi:hypothetical protein